MKCMLFLVFLFLLSCVDSSRTVKTKSFKVPIGSKLLFVTKTTRIFNESYTQENEISLNILEALEEIGYSVVLNDGVWNENVFLVPEDHLDQFHKTLKNQSFEDRSRIQIWKERAERIGAAQVLLLRFCFPSEPNEVHIRMLWINFSNNEVKQFDWFWNQKVSFSLDDIFQQTDWRRL